MLEEAMVYEILTCKTRAHAQYRRIEASLVSGLGDRKSLTRQPAGRTTMSHVRRDEW